MAWLEEHPTSGHFKICFRFGQSQDSRRLSRPRPRGRRGRAGPARRESSPRRTRADWSCQPGRTSAHSFCPMERSRCNPTSPAAPARDPQEICDDVSRAFNPMAPLEANSLDTLRMHLRHVRKTIGNSFQVATLERVPPSKTHRPPSAKTISGTIRSVPPPLRKEIANFRACWNWGLHAGKLNGIFPEPGAEISEKR